MTFQTERTFWVEPWKQRKSGAFQFNSGTEPLQRTLTLVELPLWFTIWDESCCSAEVTSVLTMRCWRLYVFSLRLLTRIASLNNAPDSSKLLKLIWEQWGFNGSANYRCWNYSAAIQNLWCGETLSTVGLSSNFYEVLLWKVTLALHTFLLQDVGILPSHWLPQLVKNWDARN